MLGEIEAGHPQHAHRASWPPSLPAKHPPPGSAQRLQPPRYLCVGAARLMPFTLDTKPLFDAFVRCRGAPLADFSFVNNFIWLSRMSGFYQIIDECFCLFGLSGNHLTMLLPPLGGAPRQALESCFAIMDDYNPSPACAAVAYVDRDFARRLGAAGPGGRWLLEPAPPDYIYRTADLIELRGNAYKAKRGEVNHFRRAYPDHRVEPLGPPHRQGIQDLLGTWLRSRLQGLDGAAAADFLAAAELERQGIERALEHYHALVLEGLALVVDGRIEGFTFGERIGPAMASVLAEKTNLAVAGAAQYLFREFARHFADCTYLNAGDDMGLENLRRTKLSYRPVRLGEKFTVRRAWPRG